uniref:Putative secreted protein n=1 Tax=Xenopsylla cheopis TaxID=163159 RepID=A0A6M2DXY6_XENCH
MLMMLQIIDLFSHMSWTQYLKNVLIVVKDSIHYHILPLPVSCHCLPVKQKMQNKNYLLMPKQNKLDLLLVLLLVVVFFW